MLRTHQVRSDLQRISVIRLSGAGVWTNTKEASPIAMLVPMAIPMFDLNSTGSMALARPRPVQRPTRKSSEASPAAPEGIAGAAPASLVEELSSEPEAASPEAPDVSEALGEPEPQPAAESEPLPAPEPQPSSSVETHTIELIIDSLPHQQLIETIPVTVESLGDKVFTATVHPLNLVGTGNTLGDALIIVKEQIEILHDQLTKATKPDDDEKRYVEYLQSHIKEASSRESRSPKKSLWR